MFGVWSQPLCVCFIKCMLEDNVFSPLPVSSAVVWPSFLSFDAIRISGPASYCLAPCLRLLNHSWLIERTENGTDCIEKKFKLVSFKIK